MRKYQSGVSLVQTLVAGGLVSVIGVGVMNLLSNMNKSVAIGKSDVEITAIHSEIRAILANPLSCEATLSGNSPNTAEGTITDIDKVLPDGGGTVQRYIVSEDKNDPNHKYGQGQIRILGYSLDDTKGEVGSSDQTTFIYTRFYRGKASKTKDIVVKSKIYYELDGSGIKTCRSIGIGDEHIWSRVDTAQDNIYYNGGRVGIGNSNPAHLFHVTQNSSFPSDNNLVFEGLNSIDMHSDIHKVNTHGAGGFWVNIFDESNNLKGEFQFKANDLLEGPLLKIRRPKTHAQVKLTSNAVKFIGGQDSATRWKSNFILDDSILKLQMLRFDDGAMEKGAYFQFTHTGDFNLHGTGRTDLRLIGPGNSNGAYAGLYFYDSDVPHYTWAFQMDKNMTSAKDGDLRLRTNNGSEVKTVMKFGNYPTDNWVSFKNYNVEIKEISGKGGRLFVEKRLAIGDNRDDPNIELNRNGNGDIKLKGGGDIKLVGGDLKIVGGKVKAPEFISNSDKKLKENIKNLPQILPKILHLKGKSYRFKKDSRKKERFGFLAQEVEKIFPQLISTDKNGLKSLNYLDLIALLVKALQEHAGQSQKDAKNLQRQSYKIDELKDENNLQRDRISNLEDQIEKQRVEMEKIKQVLKL